MLAMAIVTTLLSMATSIVLSLILMGAIVVKPLVWMLILNAAMLAMIARLPIQVFHRHVRMLSVNHEVQSALAITRR